PITLGERGKSRLSVLDLLVQGAIAAQDGFENLGCDATCGEARSLRGRIRHAGDLARNSWPRLVQQDLSRPGFAQQEAGSAPTAAACASIVPRSARWTAGRPRRVAAAGAAVATQLACKLVERSDAVLG